MSGIVVQSGAGRHDGRLVPRYTAAIQPVTGFLGSLASPYPIKYFGYTLALGSWDVPAAKEFLSVVHLANASTLIVLILVHIGAVLHHLLVARDGVFQRMWFAARD